MERLHLGRGMGRPPDPKGQVAGHNCKGELEVT